MKKCPQNILDKILDEVIPEIQANPASGEMLKGNWKPSRSYHFHRKPEYRLVYRVYNCRTATSPPLCELMDKTNCDPMVVDCDGLINFVLLGTREEFNRLYNLKKKDIDQYSL